ncbi:hypothetical protein HEP87_64675 [Streptomyces sp. S1D4-11]
MLREQPQTERRGAVRAWRDDDEYRLAKTATARVQSLGPEFGPVVVADEWLPQKGRAVLDVAFQHVPFTSLQDQLVDVLSDDVDVTVHVNCAVRRVQDGSFLLATGRSIRWSGGCGGVAIAFVGVLVAAPGCFPTVG